MGSSNENSNTSLIRVRGEGREEMKRVVDGAQSKGEGFAGTVNFL